MKGFASLLKLCWIISREAFFVLAALARADARLAGVHARILVGHWHEDLLQLVVALQRRLSIGGTLDAGIDRILIVKLDRIGDMVTTTPVFDVLHELFPQARLDLVAHPTPLSLLEGDDRIAERIPYKSWLYHPLPILPPGPKTWVLILRLLWRRYPLVVYLRGSPAFLLLGLRSRLAAAKFVEGEAVIQRYLKALAPLGARGMSPPPRLHIEPEAARFARELLLGKNGHAGPRIVIHATASAATKMWPAERFAALADELSESANACVHFMGSPADRPLLDNIAKRAARRHAYHSALRLPQVVAVIAACNLFVGNDSGLAHIAAAAGTRMVVLWGPVNLNMARPAAPPERCTILYHDLPCRAVCPEFKCINPVRLECLMRIETHDVVEAALRMLPERRLCVPSI